MLARMPPTDRWPLSPEKPAAAHATAGEQNGSAPEILIKVINSVEGFPVELVYATPVSEMGRFGRVGTHLPRPDMVVNVDSMPPRAPATAAKR